MTPAPHLSSYACTTIPSTILLHHILHHMHHNTIHHTPAPHPSSYAPQYHSPYSCTTSFIVCTTIRFTIYQPLLPRPRSPGPCTCWWAGLRWVGVSAPTHPSYRNCLRPHLTATPCHGCLRPTKQSESSTAEWTVQRTTTSLTTRHPHHLLRLCTNLITKLNGELPPEQPRHFARAAAKV